MRECTFKPKITPRSLQIVANNPRIPFETKAEKLQKLKIERLKNLQQIYMLKEQKKIEQ
jgi:hypothetical protein